MILGLFAKRRPNEMKLSKCLTKEKNGKKAKEAGEKVD